MYLLSTPCYGFSESTSERVTPEAVKLSTPCYGFETLPERFAKELAPFQLHVMDSGVKVVVDVRSRPKSFQLHVMDSLI